MRYAVHIILILLMVVVAILPLWLMPQPMPHAPECDPAPAPVLRRARIVAVGDLMQHEEQLKAALRSDSTTYDYSRCFKYVAPHFREADISIVNLETTLSRQAPYTGYPMFRSPAELAVTLQKAGVDAVGIANNHICDRGAAGIRSTIGILDSLGIEYAGAYVDSLSKSSRSPLYISANGFNLALLNYTYGTNGIPTPRGMVVNRIDTLQMAADIAMVVITVLPDL